MSIKADKRAIDRETIVEIDLDNNSVIKDAPVDNVNYVMYSGNGLNRTIWKVGSDKYLDNQYEAEQEGYDKVIEYLDMVETMDGRRVSREVIKISSVLPREDEIECGEEDFGKSIGKVVSNMFEFNPSISYDLNLLKTKTGRKLDFIFLPYIKKSC